MFSVLLSRFFCFYEFRFGSRMHTRVNSFESTPSFPWVFSSIFAQEHVFLALPCFTLSIRAGSFEPEVESIFWLRPVVSGSFHWEHSSHNIFLLLLKFESSLTIWHFSLLLAIHFKRNHSWRSTSSPITNPHGRFFCWTITKRSSERITVRSRSAQHIAI